MSPRAEPHTIESVEEQIAEQAAEFRRQPATLGLIITAIGGAMFIITNTVAVVMYVGSISAESNKNFASVDRKADMLAQQIEAGKAQRDLSMRNRDLQLDAIKTEQDRMGKRQDAFELVVSDLSRKTERILVVVESLKERQDKQAASGH